jgi:hypothetical protein
MKIHAYAECHYACAERSLLSPLWWASLCRLLLCWKSLYWMLWRWYLMSRCRLFVPKGLKATNAPTYFPRASVTRLKKSDKLWDQLKREQFWQTGYAIRFLRLFLRHWWPTSSVNIWANVTKKFYCHDLQPELVTGASVARLKKSDKFREQLQQEQFWQPRYAIRFLRLLLKHW